MVCPEKGVQTEKGSSEGPGTWSILVPQPGPLPALFPHDANSEKPLPLGQWDQTGGGAGSECTYRGGVSWVIWCSVRKRERKYVYVLIC
jgi:hypothetical protein